jgi:NAD(P)-dependent dehydrogenase (short-subunit alcohol dehydrogenase family)
LDVANEAQAKGAVDAAMKASGRIDVLVNNAGYSLLGNFEELSTAEIEKLMATNFYGVMYVCLLPEEPGFLHHRPSPVQTTAYYMATELPLLQAGPASTQSISSCRLSRHTCIPDGPEKF